MNCDQEYIKPESIMQEYIDDHGFLSWLDVRVEKADYGTLVMQVPFDETLTSHAPDPNGNGKSFPSRIQDGITATLLDTAGGIVLWPYLDDPFSGSVATINLNVNYFRPASDDLTATASVVRAGSSVGVSRVTITSDTPEGETKTVAVGHGAYRLLRVENTKV